MKQKAGSTHARPHAKQKKGYYARRFYATEVQDLQADTSGGLLDEIELMRVIIRRFFDITADEATSLDDWVKAVSTLGNAAMRLSRLMVANRKLESDQEAKNEIKQAIDSVLKNVLPPGPEQLL